MTFYSADPFTPSPGTAFKAFNAGDRNPMLPQDTYRPQAAGPAYLAGLGKHSYYAPLRQMRLPLRGFGDPLSDLLGSGFDTALQTVVVRAMPIVHRELKPTIMPFQVMAGLTLALAGASAVFAFLTWNKSR